MKTIVAFLLSALLLISHPSIYAHPGRTNSFGCHNDDTSEGRHCHFNLPSDETLSPSDKGIDILSGLLVIGLATVLIRYIAQELGYTRLFDSNVDEDTSSPVKIFITPEGLKAGLYWDIE